ncbi:MAG: DALR domain-containing protein, partial [Rhodothermales bacterium]
GTFPDYGKLSGNVMSDELREMVRDVVEDEGKRDPRDFALWKKDPSHLMLWYSPWGWGFPGWHIECSAMSIQYLGEQFDIHTGGEDNKFPHHECEIAQAEAITGKEFVKYWVHTRFLQVEGEKMSKSLGNFLTVRDLLLPESEGGRGSNPLALRLALISGQYRNPYNFTFDQLRASAKHIQRFEEAAELVERASKQHEDGDDRIGSRLDLLYEKALEAMLDDLNTPEAIAASIEGAKMIQGFGANLNAASARAAHTWLNKINGLLGIVRHESDRPVQEEADDFARVVDELIEQRAEARRSRDFARADAIRRRLDEMEIEVMDSAEGTKWRRKV